MATTLKTIGAAAALIAAFGVASSAFACSHSTSAGDAKTFAQNATTGGDRNDIQKQTDPARNGTSQSEDQNGANKNGQPQK